MALISAHRCGSEGDAKLENTRTALEHVITIDCEFVEFDVQRCLDGVFVLFHDDHVNIKGRRRRVDEVEFAEFSKTFEHFLRYDDALVLLEGRKRAHIDFKFTSPKSLYADPASTYEVQALLMAAEILGEENMIITSLEDRSVLAMQQWSKEAGMSLLVGLSLGRDLQGVHPIRRLPTRLSEIFPHRRVKACRANLIVANKSLARLTLANFADRRGLPLLVWTVDDDDDLEYWLQDPRAWMVTTNFPRRAVRIRKKSRGGDSLLRLGAPC